VTIGAAAGVVLVAATALGISAFLWRSRIDPDLLRSSRLRRIAQDMDWNYESGDVFDYSAMTFATLDGHDGRASNVLLGVTRGGGPVCAFDYRCHANGRTARYSCVLAELDTVLPHMLVEPDAAEVLRPSADDDAVRSLEPVEGFPGLAIRSDDPDRVGSLLRRGTARWLVDRWPDAAFEVSGSLLVTFSPLAAPSDVGDLVRATDGLRRQLDLDGQAADDPSTR
jgi:hypothetical protein